MYLAFRSRGRHILIFGMPYDFYVRHLFQEKYYFFSGNKYPDSVYRNTSAIALMLSFLNLSETVRILCLDLRRTVPSLL